MSVIDKYWINLIQASQSKIYIFCRSRLSGNKENYEVKKSYHGSVRENKLMKEDVGIRKCPLIDLRTRTGRHSPLPFNHRFLVVVNIDFPSDYWVCEWIKPAWNLVLSNIHRLLFICRIIETACDVFSLRFADIQVWWSVRSVVLKYVEQHMEFVKN